MQPKRLRWLMATLFSIFPVVAMTSETMWVPGPQFTLEDGGLSDTLTFVAGVAHGLGAASQLEASSGRAAMYCLPEDKNIDLRLLMELLNTRLAAAGEQSAAMIAETAAVAMAEEYGCDRKD